MKSIVYDILRYIAEQDGLSFINYLVDYMITFDVMMGMLLVVEYIMPKEILQQHMKVIVKMLKKLE